MTNVDSARSGKLRCHLPAPGAGGFSWRNLGLLGVAALLVACSGSVVGGNAASMDRPSAEQAFATVNGETILLSTYQTALHMGARQRFYHGKAPEAELQAYRRELGQQLVEHELMHQEALRRGIDPDQGRVQADLGKMVQRYAQSPQWADREADVLPVLRQGLQRGDRVRQLEAQWRDAVADPTEKQLRAFYLANPNTFTSPPRTQVSMVLLKVPPWASKPDWDVRLEEGKRIHQEILDGLAFADAARRYSEDPSAENGGDMGYLHRGMLGTKAEAAVDGLRKGEMSGPVVLLEGIALFHLVDQTDAQLNPFEQVEERARKLWLREQREEAVKLGKQRLRDAAKVRFADPRYFELQPQSNGRTGGTAS